MSKGIGNKQIIDYSNLNNFKKDFLKKTSKKYGVTNKEVFRPFNTPEKRQNL